MLTQLEQKLDEWFVKKAPFQLPENGKKTLANFMPWLALVAGVLTLLGAWSMFQLTFWMIGWANAYGLGYNFAYPFVWVNLLLLVAEAVLFFAAFPALRAYKKIGWRLLFVAALLNVLYAVVYLFMGMQLGSFLFSLLGSAVGLYLLFQIRSRYDKDELTEARKSPEKQPSGDKNTNDTK